MLAPIRLLALLAIACPAALAGPPDVPPFAPDSWAVTEFRDATGHSADLGRVSAQIFADELAKVSRKRVVLNDALKFTGINAGFDQNELWRLRRAATLQDVDAMVRGEIIGYRRDGRKSFATVRVVVFDMSTDLAMTGGQASVEGVVRSEGKWVEDVVRQATLGALKAMRSRSIPMARVSRDEGRQSHLDKGSEAGFEKGMVAVSFRGGMPFQVGEIGSADRGDALFRYTRSGKGTVKGDRVVGLYSPDRLNAMSW